MAYDPDMAPATSASASSASSGEAPARLRLPREHRLRLRGDFQRTYAEGSRARGAFLLVVVRANGLEHTRYGLSVGKRIWKPAVRRNRIRRVFREAFRHALPGLPKGFDVILVCVQPRLAPRLAPVQAELERLVAKAVRRWHERAQRAQSDPAGGDAPSA